MNELLTTNLDGIVRQKNFKLKFDQDGDSHELEVVLDFSETSVGDLIDKAMRTIIIDLQSHCRKLETVDAVEKFLEKPYIVGQSNKLPPEVAMMNAFSKMTEEQRQEFITKLNEIK